MKRDPHIFTPQQPAHRPFSWWNDVIVLIAVAVLIYVGARLALSAPAMIEGPTISLNPSALPFYASLSLRRMLIAYILSFLFTVVYGYIAAYNRSAEHLLVPLLDVLQSVPILSFLPVVLLSLSAFLPQRLAIELASIILVFTCQVWNMTFAWYQSLKTIPMELREASTIFHFNGWMRFKTLELPFAAISLIWNSMMSWAGGWFFLMAAEIFTAGKRDFSLPGLGSYLKEAANQGDLTAMTLGIITLILVIVILDQLVWRPLLTWADRFKLETVEGRVSPTSWFYDALCSSRIISWLSRKVFSPIIERLDEIILNHFPMTEQPRMTKVNHTWVLYLLIMAGVLGLLYGAYLTGQMLLTVPLAQWKILGSGLIATLMRVLLALIIALLWTLPVGVAIGSNPRLTARLQPLMQIIASVPATALFPILVVILLGLPGGLNLAAILLMLMGTQWYLLFNIIAGTTAIPQDLKDAATMLQLDRWTLWRTLILPSLFPYIITGAITSAGGAWNASIIAEYIEFGGKTLSINGIGALISEATANGDYPLLLAATLSMILTVVIINRFVWRRLYRIAEERYRLE
jgi:NitT/TauT family transport system permease protein